VTRLSAITGSTLVVVTSAVAFAGAVSVAMWGHWHMDSGPDAADQTSPAVRVETLQRTASSALELVSARASLGAIGNFWIVEGEVKNVSSDTFDRVEAIATWFDPSGAALAVDSAVIDAVLLRPGATSGFRVLTPVRSDLAAFTINFRDLHGQTLTAFGDERHPLDPSEPSAK
jgi:hypothetical protein